MKTMVLLFVVAVACCSLGSGRAAATDSEEDTETAPWRVIASGAHSQIEASTRQVIQTEEAWHAWWRRHNPITEYVDGKERKPKPPPVDFSRETVLIATMGRRSTGGYGIEFTHIQYEGDTLVATLQTTAPGPNDLVTMALTAPYAIIAVPRHEGPIRFVEQE